MANNYTLFSTIVNGLTKREQAWLLKMAELRIQLETDTVLSESNLKKIEEVWGAVDEMDFGMCNMVVDTSIKEPNVGFYSDDSSNPWVLAQLMRAFFKKFRGGEGLFRLCWADTCSKPRYDEFGGGTVVVLNDKIYFYTTDQIADMILANKGGIR